MTQLVGPEAEFLDIIVAKVLIVFPLAIHRHIFSFALRFYFFKLMQPLKVSTFQLLYTVKENGGKLIKTMPPSL